jgi:NAD(P)-dependent dehydrogenase (short-subunit alcohol dehydrogenase family)
LNPIDFAGKAVFVTGASSGVGRAIALSFAKTAVRTLVLTGRDQARLGAVEGECRALRAVVSSLAGNMGSTADIDNVAAFVAEKMGGKLDVFVGNHGFARESQAFPDVDLKALAAVMDVNFASSVRLTYHLSRLIPPGGSIVYVSSISSVTSCKASASYCCSKAALTMLAKCAALELGGRAIRVNSVAPGYIDTPFHNKFYSSEQKQTKQLSLIGARASLARIPTTEGIENAILFLASDLARDITGTEQIIDCGFSISWAD